MNDLGNRIVDDYGNVIFKSTDIYPLILKGYDVLSFTFDNSEETQQLIASCFELSNDDLKPTVYSAPAESVESVMEQYKNNWFTPEEFMQIDVEQYLLDKCETQQEINRVKMELLKYSEYKLIPVLQTLIYVIETFKQHNILWGVGRGSSVSSYVLYLIGIHRVNSIKYDLPFNEFLE